MKAYSLYVDSSVDPRSKKAFGAFLLIEDGTPYSNQLQLECIQFENTSSSKAELQTLVYALKGIEQRQISLHIYSDSNSILSLLKRRASLEEKKFRSKNDRLLNQHELYREFYTLIDLIECKFFKVKGHSKSPDRDKFFSLVDKASRKALRSDLIKN
jgi:ribonuclease HI